MTTAHDRRGPFDFIDQHFIPSDTALKPFCDSKIGFPDFGGDAFGFGLRSTLILHRTDTKTSPPAILLSRICRPASISRATVRATSATQSFPEWRGTIPVGSPPPPDSAAASTLPSRSDPFVGLFNCRGQLSTRDRPTRRNRFPKHVRTRLDPTPLSAILLKLFSEGWLSGLKRRFAKPL
jgi:hypothetical protein